MTSSRRKHNLSAKRQFCDSSLGRMNQNAMPPGTFFGAAVAVEGIRDGADERQTDASAAGLTGTGAVGAVEFLPDFRQLFLGQTLALIENSQTGVFFSREAEIRFYPLRGIADGVRQVIHEHLVGGRPLSVWTVTCVFSQSTLRPLLSHSTAVFLHRVVAHLVQVVSSKKVCSAPSSSLDELSSCMTRRFMGRLRPRWCRSRTCGPRVVRHADGQALGVTLNEGRSAFFQLVDTLTMNSRRILSMRSFSRTLLRRQLVVGLLSSPMACSR